MIKNSLVLPVLKSVSSSFLKNSFSVFGEEVYSCLSFYQNLNMSLFSLQSEYALRSLSVKLHMMCSSFPSTSLCCTFQFSCNLLQ